MSTNVESRAGELSELISFVLCSFFGAQKGDFSLTIKSIVALAKIPKDAIVLVPASRSDAWQVEAGQPQDNTEATLVGFKIDSRFLKVSA